MDVQLSSYRQMPRTVRRSGRIDECKRRVSIKQNGNSNRPNKQPGERHRLEPCRNFDIGGYRLEFDASNLPFERVSYQLQDRSACAFLFALHPCE